MCASLFGTDAAVGSRTPAAARCPGCWWTEWSVGTRPADVSGTRGGAIPPARRAGRSRPASAHADDERGRECLDPLLILGAPRVLGHAPSWRGTRARRCRQPSQRPMARRRSTNVVGERRRSPTRSLRRGRSAASCIRRVENTGFSKSTISSAAASRSRQNAARDQLPRTSTSSKAGSGTTKTKWVSPVNSCRPSLRRTSNRRQALTGRQSPGPRAGNRRLEPERPEQRVHVDHDERRRQRHLRHRPATAADDVGDDDEVDGGGAEHLTEELGQARQHAARRPPREPALGPPVDARPHHGPFELVGEAAVRSTRLRCAADRSGPAPRRRSPPTGCASGARGTSAPSCSARH